MLSSNRCFFCCRLRAVQLVVFVMALLLAGHLSPAAIAHSIPAPAQQDEGVLYLPLLTTTSAGALPLLPVISKFEAEPAMVAPGGTSTLSWEVTGSTTLSITPDIGSVSGGSVTVQPTAKTTYTLYAGNAAGTVTAQTVVDVSSPSHSGSGALWLPFRTADDGVVHTRGTNLAVDAQGGVHVAYAVRTGVDQDQRPAYYAYCAADCSLPEQWAQARLTLDTWVADVRVALDPNGHPRLLIFSHPPADVASNHYTYAVCDQGCTDPGQWTLTPIVTAQLNDATRWDYAFRYFALDAQGHPAFIYTDSSQGINHNGTFYTSCMAAAPSACTNAANWSELQLDPHWLGTPSLVFSPSGQPRAMLFYWDNSGDEVVMRLLYLACDANCDNLTNWQGLFLANLHGTTRFSLRVDSQGRPRLAFYSGQYPDPAFQANRLYYLWCNNACTDSASHDWQMHDLGLSAHNGKDVDLALDELDRPRMAYHAIASGLGYTWCNTNCESDTATWQHQEVEASSALEADYPVAPIRRCSLSVWVSGETPTLALDRDGHPRIGYVAEHGYGGDDLDHPGQLCPTSTDIVLARFALLSQP
jgi:hypothetical protein